MQDCCCAMPLVMSFMSIVTSNEVMHTGPLSLSFVWLHNYPTSKHPQQTINLHYVITTWWFHNSFSKVLKLSVYCDCYNFSDSCELRIKHSFNIIVLPPPPLPLLRWHNMEQFVHKLRIMFSYPLAVWYVSQWIRKWQVKYSLYYVHNNIPILTITLSVKLLWPNLLTPEVYMHLPLVN